MSRVTRRILNKYEVLGQLGATGLASAYKVQDSATNTVVVLKVLRAYFTEETKLLQPFLQEMERVRELRHPNIVSVHSVEQDVDTTAVVMDYVPWPTLKARKAGPMPLRQAIPILRQVAAALDYAHEKGIVHRDLRPSNVFYDQESGQVLVSDFGIARLAESGHALIRTTLNTPAPGYAPPEQIQGMPRDLRNDVYSLGALAYELLTGQLPFDALSPHTILARQLTITPTPPSHLVPGLPPAVDNAVLTALKRKPEERFSSCVGLVEALTKALGTSPDQQPAAPQPPTPQVATTEAPAHAAPAAAGARPEFAGVEEGRIFCPRCGTGNPGTATACSTCWGRLHAEPVISVEEERHLVTQYLTRLRRHKRLTLGTVGAVVVALLGLWVFNLVEVRPPLPGPSSSISMSEAPLDWPTAQRGNNHTGAAPAPAFTPAKIFAWTFQANGPILNSPAVVDGRVYLGTNDRRVMALDAATGAVLWNEPVPVQANSTPTVAGDLVYFGLRDGRIQAHNRENGALVWSFKADAAIYGAPTVVDGVLYVGSSDNRIYSLDAATGALRWKRDTQNWVVGSPTVGQGVLVIGGQDRELYMLDANNGTLRYQVNIGTGIDNSTSVVGNIAYFSTRSGDVVAFDFTKKDVRFQKAVWHLWVQLWVWNVAPMPKPVPGLIWARRLEDPVIGDLAVADGKLFVASVSGKLRALELATGKVLWTSQNLGRTYSSPIVSGDTVIQATSSGAIYGVDAATGKSRWTLPIEGTIISSPVLASNTLFVPTTEGRLYAIR